MIYIGEYKELNPHSDFPSMRDSFEAKAYEGKKRIVQYLKTGTPDMVSFCLPKDVFTGEPIHMTPTGMNDGVYTWFNTLAYYVEKYNLRLPIDFEKHILES